MSAWKFSVRRARCCECRVIQRSLNGVIILKRRLSGRAAVKHPSPEMTEETKK